MASFILLRKGNIIARHRAWLKIPYKPLCQLATEGSRLHVPWLSWAPVKFFMDYWLKCVLKAIPFSVLEPTPRP